jgi:glutathione S-transferase
MILIGQYDSPFVRRVAVALRIDGDEIAPFNPLRRVPTLVLDDGEGLIESSAILDWLDEEVGGERALIPRHGVARRQALKLCALATGLGDKAVSLVYERVLHDQASAVWQARCETQIAAVLDALEQDRAARGTTYWFGASIGHADIAVACVLRFLREAHPVVFFAERWPALAAHAAHCEALAAFQAVVQTFIPPR